MNDMSSNSVLRRKVQVGQQQYQARSMTGARALRLSLAKVAEDEFDLAVSVIGLRDDRSDAGMVIDRTDENGLLLLLETGNDGPGAAVMDSAFVGALIQQQTMGRVRPLDTSAPARIATRTDAALIAPFLDILFRRAGPLPEMPDEAKLFDGVKFGAHINAKRLLVMALEDPEYQHYGLTVDIDGGAVQGRLDLLLPIPRHGEQPQIIGPEGDEDKIVIQTLEPVVMSLQAQLNVALCRMQLPFSKIAAFKPGDVVKLPHGVIENTEILTLGGRKIGQGKLGQAGGRRALKLHNGLQSRQGPERRSSDRSDGAPSVLYDRRRASDGQTLNPEAPPPIHTPDNLPELPDMRDAMAQEVAGLEQPQGSDLDLGDSLPDLPNMPDLDDLPDLAKKDSDGLPMLPSIPGLPDL